MTDYKIIEKMLEAKVIIIDEKNLITFASGIKSIVYCDLRKLIADIELRTIVVNLFLSYDFIKNADIIVGTATAGIPWASFLAWILNKPLAYVRSDAKNHGTKSLIEGTNVSDKNVVLIEDMITTGHSVINASRELLKSGAKNINIFSIFNYSFKKSNENFKNANLNFESLFKFEIILDYFKNNDLKKYKNLKEWWNQINLS
ncbi:MAG: orotate phosphoribosyltransferase [Mycoplasmoidaceae bacterium]